MKKIEANWGGPKWYWNTKYGILDQKGLIEKWQETKDIDLYNLICEMNKEDKEMLED